ncbi:hypothetical protein B0H19DRAFT_1262639 [Mycena capillaripes]|nr:hypothetical protein B0H19DRAFT_1262639 [Mycena capillaripes]
MGLTCVLLHERNSSTITLKSLAGGHAVVGFILRLDVSPAAFPIACTHRYVFEKCMVALEGSAVVVATASGQFAQWLALTVLAESGDAAANLYGGKNDQLKVTFRDLSAVHRRVDPSASAFLSRPWKCTSVTVKP